MTNEVTTVETSVLPEELLDFAKHAYQTDAQLFVEPDGQLAFYIWMSSLEASGFICGRIGRPGNWLQFFRTDGTNKTWARVPCGTIEVEKWTTTEEDSE